jgi:nitrate reductase NapE component
MSAARLMLRIMFFPIIAVSVGLVGLFGFMVLEPFKQSLSGPPSSLGWGAPGADVMTFASVGVLALLMVLAVWFISAPIRRDKRQQFRR